MDELPPILQYPPAPPATLKSIRLNKKRTDIVADLIARAKTKLAWTLQSKPIAFLRFVIFAVVLVEFHTTTLIQIVINMLYRTKILFFL